MVATFLADFFHAHHLVCLRVGITEELTSKQQISFTTNLKLIRMLIFFSGLLLLKIRHYTTAGAVDYICNIFLRHVTFLSDFLNALALPFGSDVGSRRRYNPLHNESHRGQLNRKISG